MVSRLLGALGLLVGVAALLARLAPADWPSSAGDVPRWLTSGPVDSRLAVLATAAAWACLGRLAIALVAVACGAVPSGALHTVAARVLGLAVVGAASGALVAGPAAADGPFDRPAGPAPPNTPAAAPHRPPAAPSPTPSRTSSLAPSATPPPAPTPTASRPAADPATPPVAAPHSPPATSPGHTPPAPGAARREVVVVAPGDTLWGITARRLGAAASPALTAATWPRWYAANRPVVGPDPDRILPGQRLVAPADGGAP